MRLQISKVPGTERNQLLGSIEKWGVWKWKFRRNVGLGKRRNEVWGGDPGLGEDPWMGKRKGVKGLSR